MTRAVARGRALARTRPVHRLAAVIALFPALAHADPITHEEALVRQFMFGDLTSELDGELHAEVAAQAGRVTGPRAVAGGELVWDVGACRALVAGGEGTVERDRERAQIGGSVWGGFCFPVPLNRFEFVLRGDFALQPGLASLPVAARARYTGITADFKNTFVAWRTSAAEHAVFPFAATFGTFAQVGLDTGRVTFELDAYRRISKTGHILQVLAWSIRAAGPAVPAEGGGMYLSAMAQEVSPLKLVRTSAGALGPFVVEADLAVGLAYGELTDPPAGDVTAPTDAQMSTVRYRDYDLYADATLRATRGDDTLSLRLRRAFEPTYTDELLLDTRVEASWQRIRGKHAVVAGAFAAVTQRMDRGGPIDRTPSGGVRGAYAYRLPARMQLALAAELARSFYATLDDARALDVAWTAQASASISFTTRRATP